MVNARYDADKQRWQELRVATEAQATGNAPARGAMATSGSGATTPTNTKK